jgi:biopolymer transport protein TolR
MGFALRRNDNELDSTPLSDMNVTPLVDVMLVLLIVFMVAAPLMATGIPVDLPKAQTKPLNEQKPPIVVSLDAEGRLYVDKNEIGIEEIVAALAKNAEAKDRRIHVRADQSLAYGRIVEVMGLINSGGYSKVALVSESTAKSGSVVSSDAR